MRLIRGLTTLIIANFGILSSYGQYFTRLGIGLDTRTNVRIPVAVADPNDPQFSGELLAAKYPGLGCQWGWQFVFPSATLCRDPYGGRPVRQ